MSLKITQLPTLASGSIVTQTAIPISRTVNDPRTYKITIDQVKNWLLTNGLSATGGGSFTGGNVFYGKSSYSDNTTGYWLGISSNLGKLNLGNATHYVKWDGAGLIVSGTITLSGYNIGTNGYGNRTVTNTPGIPTGGDDGDIVLVV
jgi:hypothetical protein